MAMRADDILSALQKVFPDGEIHLEDLAGDGDHYSVTIISSQFAGKTRVQQHKMVYDALGGSMGGKLHALAVKTLVKSLDK